MITGDRSRRRPAVTSPGKASRRGEKHMKRIFRAVGRRGRHCGVACSRRPAAGSRARSTTWCRRCSTSSRPTDRAIEKFLKEVGYKTVTLDADNKTDSAEPDGRRDPAEARRSSWPRSTSTRSSPAIEKAHAAGIPVMIYDRQITSTPSDLTSVAGTVEIGHIAAGEISAC